VFLFLASFWRQKKESSNYRYTKGFFRGKKKNPKSSPYESFSEKSPYLDNRL
jgi:hypothetical protein